MDRTCSEDSATRRLREAEERLTNREDVEVAGTPGQKTKLYGIQRARLHANRVHRSCSSHLQGPLL